MKKINWRERILFALTLGVGYGVIILIFKGDLSDETISEAIRGAGVFFIIFGLGFPALLEKLVPALGMKVKLPELKDNESIVWEEPAKLFHNKYLLAGGKVFLTEDRLIFNSHKYNFQNGETSISRDNIAELIERKTMGLVDNGLRVTTKDNLEFDFVLNNRVELIEKLRS